MLLFIVVTPELFLIFFFNIYIAGNETVCDVESEDNDDNCKFDLKLIDGVEKLEEPKEGMIFNSLDELASHYRTYAKQQGFGVVQKNKKKNASVYTLHHHIMCSPRQ